MTDIDAYDLLGFIGVFAAIGNYALMQWRRDYNKTLQFSLINAVASLMMCFSLIQHYNAAAFLLNAFWFFISVYGIYRCLKYDWRGAPRK